MYCPSYFTSTNLILNLFILILIFIFAVSDSDPSIRGNKDFSPNLDEEFLNFQDDPIQLVRPDHEHKKLVMVKENIDVLHKIKGPVATVAVVGKFHSGKSFLMNQLMGKRKGFGVGPSVKPETMGIWMWGKPMSMILSNGLQVSIIFLDTEGFAANNVSENYDAKIFAVATLISSHLLYNSVKIIDQADIDYLELLARRTQLFALRSQMSKAKWTSSFIQDILTFPPLIWVVQDFVQATVDGETPQKWLHRLMESHTRENENYEISLLSIFSVVDCHTLFLPATKKMLLMDLSNADEEDLTEEYRQERNDLITKLKKNIVLKEKNNRPMTGRELGSLFEILVNAANDGSLSDVPSRWNIFVERLKNSATEDCLVFFEKEVQSFIFIFNDDPVKVTELNEFYQLAFNHSLQLLNHLLQGLDVAKDEAQKRLISQLELVFERTKELNEKKITLKASEMQNHIELKTEEQLRHLKLPMLSSKLTRILIKSVEEACKNYTRELDGFLDDKRETKYLNSLKRSISHLGGDLELQNTKAIENVLGDAVKKAVALFQKATQILDDKPKKSEYLEKQFKSAAIDANNYFEKTCSEYSEESLYKPFLGMLQTEIYEHANEVKLQNEAILKIYLLKTVKSLLEKFKHNMLKITLPMDESDLLSRLELDAQRNVREFESVSEDFSQFSVYKSSIDSLMEGLRKLINQYMEENVEAFKREVEKPLNAAKQMIFLSADKYRTVFSLKQFITELSLLQLNDGVPKNWSVNLKLKIIESFISKDEQLKKILKDKEGIWSSIVGFFQWLFWFLGFC